MSKVYCIRTRQKGKHLTFEEREELEAIIQKNYKQPKKEKLSQRQIAKRMGVSPAALSRELKRGEIIIRDYEWRDVVSYSAIKAQDDYNEQATAKGPQLKIGKNYELAKKIEDCIIEDNFSPYATIEKLKDDPDYQKTPISERTLYNYIDQELMENVTKKDCHEKEKVQKGNILE